MMAHILVRHPPVDLRSFKLAFLSIVARLTGLVPKPRVNLSRFHGCLRPKANTVPGRRQMLGPIRRDCPLRANEKVV